MRRNQLSVEWKKTIEETLVSRFPMMQINFTTNRTGSANTFHIFSIKNFLSSYYIVQRNLQWCNNVPHYVKGRKAFSSPMRPNNFIFSSTSFLRNIQYAVNKPRLNGNHDSKRANCKQKHFKYTVDTLRQKLFFQIRRHDF